MNRVLNGGVSYFLSLCEGLDDLGGNAGNKLPEGDLANETAPCKVMGNLKSAGNTVIVVLYTDLNN